MDLMTVIMMKKMMILVILVIMQPYTQASDGILSISPHSAQIKAVNSKMIFTCTADFEHDISNDVTSYIHWIGPDKQVITESKGRVFVEQLDGHRLRLYITDIRNSDSGVYTCEYHTNGTITSAQSKLYLYEDIEFNNVVSDVTYEAGSSALITCAATGKPEPEMSWRFQSKKIIFDGLKYSLEKEGLRIHYVQPDDTGLYECRAEVVSQGNLKVRNIQLTVQYAPVLVHPIDVPAAVEGNDVTLECHGHGNPAVTFQWFKEVEQSDGSTEKQVVADDQTTQEVDENSVGRLHLTSVDMSDEGRYVCLISNTLGSIEASADFFVYVAPAVNVERKSLTVTEGETVHLSCQGLGRPSPNISWAFSTNQQLIASKMSGSSQELGNSVLVLQNVTRQQAGVYSCIASNDVGNATEDITVVVEFGPTVYEPAEKYELGWPDQTVTLMCSATGQPHPDIVWLRNVDEMTEDNIYHTSTRSDDDLVVSSLQIRIPNRRTTFVYTEYTCLAKNIHGTHNVTINLVEAFVPDMPRNVTVVEITASSLQISACIPQPRPVQDHGGLNVTSWIITYHADTDLTDTTKKFVHGDEMLLSGLKSDTMYAVSVAAVNEVGVGTAAKIRVRTAEKLSDDEVNMQADQGHDGAVAASWSVAENSRSVLRETSNRQPGSWSQLSVVLIVGIAVVLATVVVAVSALILHTQRRHGTTKRPENSQPNQSNDAQCTTVKVSDERDVDNLTLAIEGRSSTPAALPDELYRSLGRNAARKGQGTAEYGSVAASPRLGSRPAVAATSVISRPVVPVGPEVTTVEVSEAQRTAWNEMLEAVDRHEQRAAADEQTTVSVDEEAKQASEDEEDQDSKTDSIISDDDEEEEFGQRLPTFEGTTFLYP